MMKKILYALLLTSLLTACISMAVDSNSATAVGPDFVTATLPSTKRSYVPATLTPTPDVIITPTLAITAPPNCTDGAVLLRDVTIQDNTQVKANEKFTKTWEFQNTGTCPWIKYTLNFAAGDQMGAPLSAPIADTVSSGKAQVSVELTAPAANGTYTGFFTLHNLADKIIPIGVEKTFWVKVVVGGSSVIPTTLGASPTQSGSVPTVGGVNCNYSQNAGYVSEIISLINQARASANLPTLAVNSQLTAAAQGHSADMACNNFLGHTGSDGSYLTDRIRRTGYPGGSEIIAIGTPQNAMDQWRADPGHWDFVLNPLINEIGVGYAYYANSDYGGYITVDMGAQ
jgi:uncharacterized protein YkwD